MLARATERSREIGVQKALGASLGRIRVQFLSESLLLTLCGVSLALLGVYVAMPAFETLFGSPFRLVLSWWQVTLIVPVVALPLSAGAVQLTVTSPLPWAPGSAATPVGAPGTLGVVKGVLLTPLALPAPSRAMKWKR